MAFADEYDTFLPLRIGIKAGSPNIVGLAGEYVIPLGFAGLGIDADLSYFPIDRTYFTFLPESFEDTTFTVIYAAAGLRMYFNETADAFSIGVFAGRYQLKVEQEYHYMGQTATGSVSTGIAVLMAKLGWRWIWGNFTLAIDAGYGAGKIDDTLEITVNYPTTGRRTEVVEIKDILPIAHGIVASIEAGIAF
jgi:hypothetical protein